MLASPRSACCTGLVVCALLALQARWSEAASAPVPENHLRIGAFNIQAFGEDKLSKPNVVRRIKQIVERYDVLLIQEIRDKCEKSVRTLLDILEKPFNFVISQRLGRSATKEQYAFFYRTDRVLVLDKYQYSDPRDLFEREPFAIKIAPVFAANDTVSLIGLHTKPKNATAEIGHLRYVIRYATNKFGRDTHAIVLGDLNADCQYSTLNKRLEAGDYLTTNTRFYTWLIGEDVDTTTRTSTHCAYDRIIVRVDNTHVVPDSAKPYDFRRRFRLSEEEALEISDHFPVEVELRF